MNYTKNQLRELKIYNPHNLAHTGHSKLYIGYTIGESGRLERYPYWAVIGIDFKVAPNSGWHDFGTKRFDVTCRANKIPRLNEAIQWCYEKYGIPKDQWEKDAFGGYQIKGTIQKAVNSQKLSTKAEGG